MRETFRGGCGALDLEPPAGMSAESRRHAGHPGPGSHRTPIWQKPDHGRDRDDLRCIEGGGIKVSEKAPRTDVGLCHETESYKIFPILDL